MHAINFIFPIECVRGSLTQRQNIEYNEEGAKAWSMEDGKNTAVDYNPILIAAKRSVSGHRYYMVKTKTSVNWNANTRFNTAVFGGACALYWAITRNSALFNQCANIARQIAPKIPPRAFITRELQKGLSDKQSTITIGNALISARVDNPWRKSGDLNVNVPTTIINKYSNYLS